MSLPHPGPPTPVTVLQASAEATGKACGSPLRVPGREGGLLTRDYKHPGDINNQITQGLGSSGPVNAK